jgi:lysophospholipase L1-like esterase
VIGRAAVAALALALVAGAAGASPPAADAHYVAMGSSYAAGPGIAQSADTPPTRCTRSTGNYAHQLAARYRLRLTDVSCGGATTAHLLGPWNELPPQIDALRPDTALVTVTIGGNDVGFVAGLFKGSCEGQGASTTPFCRGMAQRAPSITPSAIDATAWQRAEAGLTAIAAAVRARSPKAKLIFVDYLTVLPSRGGCSAVPLSPAALGQSRETAARLARLTAKVTARSGATLIRASKLSVQHNACAAQPWTTGITAPPGGGAFVPYHPNLAGMTAVAEAIAVRLETPRR